jgi:predicted small secreted protein
MARRAFLLIVLAACVFLLFGCQTVQGLGEDIQWTGEKGAEIVGQ